MLLFIKSKCMTFIAQKNRNNALFRDQNSNKHIADGYKKLLRAFNREAVQFLVAKNLTYHWKPLLPFKLELKLQTRPQDRGNVTFCGLWFAVFHENLTLEVSIDEIKRRENDWRTDNLTNNKQMFNCDNRRIETHQLHYESS